MATRIFPDRPLTDKERHLRWRLKNPERAKATWRRYRKKHPALVSERSRIWHENNKPKVLWMKARKRAKVEGLPFNITSDDIVIPEKCPVLNVPFSKERDFLPSLDKLVPALGYVKGNVWIISVKANRWKNEMTLEQMKNLVVSVEKEIECQQQRFAEK